MPITAAEDGESAATDSGEELAQANNRGEGAEGPEGQGRGTNSCAIDINGRANGEAPAPDGWCCCIEAAAAIIFQRACACAAEGDGGAEYSAAEVAEKGPEKEEEEERGRAGCGGAQSKGGEGVE